MYAEDPHQNPEIEENKKIREEKPEKELKKEKPAPKKKTAKQIRAKEKKEIIKLIHDTKALKKTIKPAKVKSKPSAGKQIGSKEKKEIIGLITSHIAESPAEISGKKKISPPGKKKQISVQERKQIISLLHDGFSQGMAEAPELEEIHYEELNKQELVEMFEEVVQEKDISLIKAQVISITNAFYKRNAEEKENRLQEFIAAGGDEKDFRHAEDPLEKRFKAALSTYKRNKQRFAEQLEKEKQQNLQLKLDILNELRELINSEETLKRTYDEFRNLQNRWKEIGMVPSSELKNLWANYHFLVEQFFDKIRINKELRDLDMKKNLEQKIQLCEKAEELLFEKSILRSFKLLQKYHDEWREIGPVPSEMKEEIWERFKAATDKINQRRKEHYAERNEEQKKNYEAKVALCEKVEEIIQVPNNTLKEWQRSTDKINEVFKVWKTLGRAPKGKNDEIWMRFKSSLDTFFTNKREFLAKVKEQQMNNLNLKIDLCAQAEALKDSDDWKKTTHELINLQKEWKKIGPVPRRHSEKVWRRFRAACDEFFNRKAGYFKNIHKVEEENLEKKNKLIEEIRKFKISDDKKTNLNALKDFQRQWVEAGHVPFKDKDRIQKEYREAINALIDKMDIDKSEFGLSSYKNRIVMMKNEPDAGRWISKERNNLLTKIKKIKEDVALWENNIGFFSSSKQTEVLRKEFEKKIESAKREIKTFEEKLRLLDEV
ncbi:MAG: DUF349 domain-containing protein [Chlorobi bacterium]|nr:DUF349 domain-containing protein [Chlorobiota bacterium]